MSDPHRTFLVVLAVALAFYLGRMVDPTIYVVEPVTPATSAPAVPFTSTTAP